MMKKMLTKLSAIILSGLMAATILTGCGSKSGDSAKKEVNVICWSEYLPDDVISSFEEEKGITVNMTTYTSPDDMLAKVQSSKAGTYDLIIAPENYAPIFSKQNLLEKLDRDKIPNYTNIDSKYLGRENDPDNTYSFPYMFASAVIAVNTDVIKDKIESYADLLNSKYKDKIVIIEDSRAVYSMAAMAEGCDANDTSDKTLKAVESYLTKLLPNIHAFDGDSPKTLMINGECPIGLIYGAEALLAQKEVSSIKCYYPKEGVYLGSDSLMITADAQNKDNAYELMNYIMDGDVSAKISEEFTYINPNKAALEKLGTEYSENPLTNPADDVINRACTLTDIGDNISKIVDLWTKIKG